MPLRNDPPDCYRRFCPEFAVGSKIYFIGERLPFTVMAVSHRYTIVSRPLNKREDASLLHHLVYTGAYVSFTRAYEACRGKPVYSIIDHYRGVRGPDNYGGHYDYFDKVECYQCIDALKQGEIEISSRHSDKLDIDFKRTLKTK